MSIALMTEAWKSCLPSGSKMVLLALCDNANDQGECYPSVPRIAKKCSMGERTVQQHIADLEKSGMLRREFRKGQSTTYHLDPRRFCTPAEIAPPQISHPTPAESAPPPPQISHPTPAESAPITIIEPSIEPSGNRHKRAATASPKFSALDDLLLRGVAEQVATDWLTLRKGKHAAVTKTAIDGTAKEAAAAGMSLAEALAMCCERGWAGFKAAWVQRDQPQPGRAPTGKSSLYEQNMAAAARAKKMIFGEEPEDETV